MSACLANWASLLKELILTQTWCSECELKELRTILVDTLDRQVLGGDYGANLDKLKSLFFPDGTLVPVSLTL